MLMITSALKDKGGWVLFSNFHGKHFAVHCVKALFDSDGSYVIYWFYQRNPSLVHSVDGTRVPMFYGFTSVTLKKIIITP